MEYMIQEKDQLDKYIFDKYEENRKREEEERKIQEERSKQKKVLSGREKAQQVYNNFMANKQKEEGS